MGTKSLLSIRTDTPKINHTKMSPLKRDSCYIDAILDGLCKIRGGYLILLWLKENKPLLYGLLGALILVLYCIGCYLTKLKFGRVYTTYGGSIHWYFATL